MNGNRCRHSPRLIVLLAVGLLANAVPLCADTRIWLASVNYESARVFAPVLVLHSESASGRQWNLWVTGWTIGADRSVPRGDRQRWRVIARVTPANAHSSNFIYVNGRRDLSKSYTAASVDLAGGIDAAHTPRWTGSYRAVALYERVGQPQNGETRRAWDRPFAGVEMVQTYARVRSDSLFGARWEGFKIEAAAQVYAGGRTWSRVRTGIGGGKRVGRLFVSGHAAAFGGRSLDTVSAFLIGGSWDLGAPDMLAGFRYAEFRVKTAQTLRGGADWRIRGPFEIGIRGAYMKTSGGDRQGAAIQLTTVWKGAVIQGGIAFPGGTAPPDGRRPAVIFATVTAALVR